MANNLKSSLVRSFKNKKLHMFGVFLILAFIFLVLTKFSKTYIERIPLKVTYKNLPQEETIIINDLPDAQVEISAVGFRILTYYFKNKTLTLDLDEDVVKTDSAYIWQPKITDRIIKEKIGYAVEILSIRPDSMIIPFAHLESKYVPIVLDSDLSLSPGYDIVDSLKVVPDSVKVIGPSEELKQIDSVSTELFRVSDASESISIPVELIQPELGNVKLQDSTTEVVVNIEKFTEGTLQIPVSIINRPSNVKINYFPKSVPVSFYVNLKKFNEVVPDDFTVICDFNEVKGTNKSFFTPRLVKHPELVRSAKVKLDKIEFIITR